VIGVDNFALMELDRAGGHGVRSVARQRRVTRSPAQKMSLPKQSLFNKYHRCRSPAGLSSGFNQVLSGIKRAFIASSLASNTSLLIKQENYDPTHF